jgi:hypothetical protein
LFKFNLCLSIEIFNSSISIFYRSIILFVSFTFLCFVLFSLFVSLSFFSYFTFYLWSLLFYILVLLPLTFSLVFCAFLVVLTLGLAVPALVTFLLKFRGC